MVNGDSMKNPLYSGFYAGCCIICEFCENNPGFIPAYDKLAEFQRDWADRKRIRHHEKQMRRGGQPNPKESGIMLYPYAPIPYRGSIEPDEEQPDTPMNDECQAHAAENE